MTNTIRIIKSVYNKIDKLKFREFIEVFIKQFTDKINKEFVNLIDIDIDKSVIDFATNEQLDNFVIKMKEKNLFKTKSESLRFLLVMFITRDKNKFNFNIISISDYLKNKKGVKIGKYISK